MNDTYTKWTTLPQVKATILKKWNKGFFLKDFIESDNLFPYRVPLRIPGSNDLSRLYERARDWVQQFVNVDKTQLFRIEWQEINNRILGQNQLPVAVVFDSKENLLRYINKMSDYKQFTQSVQEVLAAFPELKDWILKQPFALIEHAPDLKRLLSIAAWMKATPKPNIYLRQLSLPDIDTKFIEQHKKLLSEWFDIILDQSVIDQTATGVKGFERRFGFREKPILIRLRILDSRKYIRGLSELTLRADESCSLNLDIDTVFVTENDINGLAFPTVENAIILFGRGYGFGHLENAHWLRNKKILYWGDIDTHGFTILNQFRKLFPSAQSILMDRETLLQHRKCWVKELTPSEATLNNLTEEEYTLYNELRENVLGDSVRLEQEFIPFDYVERFLDNITKH
ncbi:MAG: hypothetical protein GX639_03150 [Fibrobacter sp.]|nr:hypothetical protein [Fibrobacter sp.]